MRAFRTGRGGLIGTVSSPSHGAGNEDSRGHFTFCALYADRASHLVYTPKAGGPPQPGHRTQIGRALEQLGIELIPANSPQARGRCERLFGTW